MPPGIEELRKCSFQCRPLSSQRAPLGLNSLLPEEIQDPLALSSGGSCRRHRRPLQRAWAWEGWWPRTRDTFLLLCHWPQVTLNPIKPHLSQVPATCAQHWSMAPSPCPAYSHRPRVGFVQLPLLPPARIERPRELGQHGVGGVHWWTWEWGQAAEPACRGGQGLGAAGPHPWLWLGCQPWEERPVTHLRQPLAVNLQPWEKDSTSHASSPPPPPAQPVICPMCGSAPNGKFFGNEADVKLLGTAGCHGDLLPQGLNVCSHPGPLAYPGISWARPPIPCVPVSSIRWGPQPSRSPGGWWDRDGSGSGRCLHEGEAPLSSAIQASLPSPRTSWLLSPSVCLQEVSHTQEGCQERQWKKHSSSNKWGSENRVSGCEIRKPELYLI